MAKDNLIRCSFCGRDKREAKMLIAGQQGHICETCVSEAYKIVSADADSNRKEASKQSLKLLKPHAIKAYLDEYIIGQDEAKKVISVAVYNHFKRVSAAGKTKDDIEIEKSNILNRVGTESEQKVENSIYYLLYFIFVTIPCKFNHISILFIV